MNPEPAQREKSDVDIRGIVVFVIALLVAGVVIHGAVWVMYRYFEKQASQPATKHWFRSRDQGKKKVGFTGIVESLKQIAKALHSLAVKFD